MAACLDSLGSALRACFASAPRGLGGATHPRGQLPQLDVDAVPVDAWIPFAGIEQADLEPERGRVLE